MRLMKENKCVVETLSFSERCFCVWFFCRRLYQNMKLWTWKRRIQIQYVSLFFFLLLKKNCVMWLITITGKDTFHIWISTLYYCTFFFFFCCCDSGWVFFSHEFECFVSVSWLTDKLNTGSSILSQTWESPGLSVNRITQLIHAQATC